ncbi:type II CRISPR-associated endonuclease Cas1 [Nitrospirillum iridis]|uniref:CRISPR-associated endonuclease Cas1 n=1 Tax=Nitrospirillum iridis TaxID=765888 RepID=A0A7X0AZI3_9PROT|nr:type II CRISPR-associated endonuclease Cas1 [Nitrospirillum iridis]MBB6252905.1 CRISPR-associated protein Cas1 [Nitrospirillum iridis]
MAWRGVHISRAARLSLADGQMVVAQEDGTVRLPLEDIAWVVLDTPQATLSAALLSACMEAGVVVIATDDRHMPNGLCLSFHGHFRQAAVAERQVGLSQPLKKRLWQALAQRKILNQAAVLAATGRSNGVASDPVAAMAALVRSGDPDNVEARAARAYWGRLFTDFRREDDEDRRNKLLNYGYAVARAAIARALVAAGLIPAFGLHHASIGNAFNLADDLIEPFRPLVDRLVFNHQGDRAGDAAPLGVDDRRAMTGVLLETAGVGGDSLTLLAATDRAVWSLLRAMESGSAALLELPEVIV